MKISKLFLLAIATVISFSACQKNIDGDNSQLVHVEQNVSVIKGVVTFPSVANYLRVAENKANEQEKVNIKLKQENFEALKTKKILSNTNNFNGTIINAFDPTKYSTYLLSILNQDKICSINGFYVKVDMDNEFCSAIDQSVANSYSLLNTNAFLNNNTNVMLFTNVNEPVLEVLDKIRNGQLTWAAYQVQLSSAKGGQGICFKSGIKAKEDKSIQSLSGYTVYVGVLYVANFIHFELRAETWARWGIASFAPHNMVGSFEWVGACKGGGIGNYSVTKTTSGGGDLWYTAYSGGSALAKGTITAKTTAWGWSGGTVVSKIVII